MSFIFSKTSEVFMLCVNLNPSECEMCVRILKVVFCVQQFTKTQGTFSDSSSSSKSYSTRFVAAVLPIPDEPRISRFFPFLSAKSGLMARAMYCCWPSLCGSSLGTKSVSSASELLNSVSLDFNISEAIDIMPSLEIFCRDGQNQQILSHYLFCQI